MSADHKIIPHARMKIEKSFVILRGFRIIQIVEKLLSHCCQQSAIASREISGTLEGAIGPAVGIPQDFAIFKPCPCIFRSDGKQPFDCLCGVIEPCALKLDSRKD
jgi:hypothetical protein